MKRLLEIAQALSVLRRGLKDHQIELAHWEADIAARELFLTPVDGWTGKNESARDAARDRAFAEDAQLKEQRAKRDELRRVVADLESQVAALEDERRAWEWAIRDRLVEALSGRRNGREAVEQTAFDDGADQALVEEAETLPF